jgi:hypothetical protein
MAYTSEGKTRYATKEGDPVMRLQRSTRTQQSTPPVAASSEKRSGLRLTARSGRPTLAPRRRSFEPRRWRQHTPSVPADARETWPLCTPPRGAELLEESAEPATTSQSRTSTSATAALWERQRASRWPEEEERARTFPECEPTQTTAFEGPERTQARGPAEAAAGKCCQQRPPGPGGKTSEGMGLGGGAAEAGGQRGRAGTSGRKLGLGERGGALRRGRGGGGRRAGVPRGARALRSGGCARGSRGGGERGEGLGGAPDGTRRLLQHLRAGHASARSCPQMARARPPPARDARRGTAAAGRLPGRERAEPAGQRRSSSGTQPGRLQGRGVPQRPGAFRAMSEHRALRTGCRARARTSRRKH